MRNIPELKTYEIKLLKKYCEKMIYVFQIFDNETTNLLKSCITICDTELQYR